MLKKPAVMLIEYADGSTETKVGEKGTIYAETKALIAQLNESNPGVVQVVALDKSGMLKGRKFKGIEIEEAPEPVASESVGAPSDEQPEGEQADDAQGDDEAEAKELRAKLRAAKISYSPRSGIDLLRKMVADAGI